MEGGLDFDDGMGELRHRGAGRRHAKADAKQAQINSLMSGQAWRRFAHNIAWVVLIVAIVVIVMVLLAR